MKYATPRRTSTAFNRQRTGKRFALDRSLLPTPLDYYTGINSMRLLGTGEWCTALCPFHDDKTPSLRINIRNGAFKCFVCEAKGGDIIAFHMQRHNLPFIEACKSLGVWEQSA